MRAGMAPMVPSGELAPQDEPWWQESDRPRDAVWSVPQVPPVEHWFTVKCREADRRSGR